MEERTGFTSLAYTVPIETHYLSRTQNVYQQKTVLINMLENQRADVRTQPYVVNIALTNVRIHTYLDFQRTNTENTRISQWAGVSPSKARWRRVTNVRTKQF